jgi:predicted metal-dependent enzyme (double-stranded beta helix superfamily)
MRADDTFFVDTPTLRAFVAEVQRIIDASGSPAEAVQALKPAFGVLLADQSWLPEAFQRPDPEGGMGEAIGNYLIYRSALGDLTLFSLVLPPGAATPVHDHLAWGLVGLYGGEQDEWVYRRVDADREEGRADLEETERRHLQAGDFYELLPPEGDIHRVQTTGSEPSVSLHLLGNDVGCLWRHRYEPEAHAVYPFRSGYSNAPCPEDGAAAT